MTSDQSRKSTDDDDTDDDKQHRHLLIYHQNPAKRHDKLANIFWKKAIDPPPPPPPPNLTIEPGPPSARPRSITMSRTPDQPRLTPQFCFNTTALRDFLRISRGTVDDTISQNLNALVTPGTSQTFDPTSTSSRTPRPIYKRPIEAGACGQFKDKVLFPSWQTRSDVLNYCAGVATSPDPDDPEHLLRQTENLKAVERMVDERLDPYSARYYPREARTEALAYLIRNERMVENIVRRRTWGIVGERCENEGVEFETALDMWRHGGEEGRS